MAYNFEAVWLRTYGNVDKAVDPYGRIVHKMNFTCDYIWPKERGGSNNIKNVIAIHPSSKIEKQSHISGIVNGKRFVVMRVSQGIGKLYVN